MIKSLYAGVAMLAAVLAVPAVAQESSYKPGTVWVASRIDVLPGQSENYMDYLAKTWKKIQELGKAEGIVVEYHVLATMNARADEPDLILITPQFAASRAQLERIAPVQSLAIYSREAEGYVGAQQVTRELAALLEREAEGEALIERIDARLLQVRQRLSQYPLPAFYIATFLDARHVRLFGKQSLYQGVLDRVGLRNAWQGPTNYWGFTQAGIERLAEQPQAALIYLEPLPPGTAQGLDDSALWQRLPMVREQRVYGLPPVWSFNGLLAAERFAGLLEQRLSEEYGHD